MMNFKSIHNSCSFPNFGNTLIKVQRGLRKMFSMYMFVRLATILLKARRLYIGYIIVNLGLMT